MDRIARARLNALLLEKLVVVLQRQVQDPRVEGVTLTGVEVTNDLAVATVYYSLLGDEERRRVAQRGLENAAGLVRREMGRGLRLRCLPRLQFHFDDSLERGQRIETLLREWHEEDPLGAGGMEEGEDHA